MGRGAEERAPFSAGRVRREAMGNGASSLGSSGAKLEGGEAAEGRTFSFQPEKSAIDIHLQEREKEKLYHWGFSRLTQLLFPP